jgi:NAD(P)-dependent dehydrogenase (short-subunit alcohol dehydrogenase family)
MVILAGTGVVTGGASEIEARTVELLMEQDANIVIAEQWQVPADRDAEGMK